MKEYDFVVIGSGIAGLSFALKVAKHGSVAVVTKRKGADTNTAWAQGGISCVTSDEDSFGLHARDTIVAGAGLCDEAVVRTVVTEGPERIRELMQLGLQFDEREISGHRELDLGREGGHSKRRVLHVRDVTGKEIEDTLLRELGRSRNSGIELLENHMVQIRTSRREMVWRWPGEQAPRSQTWSSSNFIRHVFSTLRQNHFSFRKRCAAKAESCATIAAKIL